MHCIEIVRGHGTHGNTRVLITSADSKEYTFMVGRHVGARRIYELASILKLREVEK
ncbi:hypothetical protein [Sporosarcina sp. ITBMC105]